MTTQPQKLQFVELNFRAVTLNMIIMVLVIILLILKIFHGTTIMEIDITVSQ